MYIYYVHQNPYFIVRPQHNDKVHPHKDYFEVTDNFKIRWAHNVTLYKFKNN